MDSLGGLLFPLLILLLFIPIFLSGRKQRAQMQQMQQLQSALSVGDVVTTTSGLRGTVVDASYEDTVDLEIADGVVTTWLRAAVRDKVVDSEDAVADDVVEDGPADDRPADRTADDRLSDDRVADERPAGADPVPGRTGPVGGDGPASTGPASTGTPTDANGSHRP